MIKGLDHFLHNPISTQGDLSGKHSAYNIPADPASGKMDVQDEFTNLFGQYSGKLN